MKEGYTPTPERALTIHRANRGAGLVWGYTMVEMVVILSIVTAVSSVVLFSFTGLSEGAALNRSARELALAIRQAQNMSLAVTQISVGSPPVAQIPPAVGIRLNTGEPNIYFLFADLPNVDNKYSGESEKIPGTQITFERRVKINRILDESGTSKPLVHIIFAAPEATEIITDSAGSATLGEKVDIELVSPSGTLKRTITVRISGQVNIK